MNAVAAVDPGAMAHNVRAFRELAPDAAVCAVVKADGYGHGALTAARAALSAGAQWLAVATVPEAIQLAPVADPLEVPVLILSERPAHELQPGWAGLPRTARLVIGSPQGAKMIESLVGDPGDGNHTVPGHGMPVHTVPIHMMVDTGMHRMGVDPAEAVALADLISDSPGLTLEGLCTHFAVADDPANPFTSVQIERFDAVLGDLAAAGHQPPVIHMANSAAAFTRPDTHRSMIRLGIAMYGVAPSAELRGVADLRPALTLTTEVSAIRTVQPSETVSYGRQWTASEPTRIATLPVGYADGIRRSSGAAGVEVLIAGSRRPVVGAVTMDQTMVAVDESVLVGDSVVLIGSDGAHTIAADEVADRLGTIPYEVLVSLGQRITRRVVE